MLAAMAKFFDRVGKVVKAEWNHRFGETSDAELAAAIEEAEAAATQRATSTAPTRVPAVSDVDGALRVLELSSLPSLAEVRAQYRALARRYHPRTRSASPDQVHAAHTVLEALTDALELLEERLLPLPEQPAR
jgi:hypothetical protein